MFHFYRKTTMMCCVRVFAKTRERERIQQQKSNKNEFSFSLMYHYI